MKKGHNLGLGIWATINWDLGLETLNDKPHGFGYPEFASLTNRLCGYSCYTKYFIYNFSAGTDALTTQLHLPKVQGHVRSQNMPTNTRSTPSRCGPPSNQITSPWPATNLLMIKLHNGVYALFSGMQWTV